jgi:DNA-directed RNA polymerase subunit RPC12/RpoP
MRCPNCSKGRMFRSKQSVFERLVYGRLGFYPWRCHRCSVRKMLRAREEQQNKPSPIWMG